MKSVFVSVQPRNADFFLQGSGLRPHNISIILPLEKEPLPRRAGANAAVGGAGASIAQMYICTACWGKPQSPMPPASGELTAELRHKSETNIGAAICSAAWGALCRCVRFYGPTAHPCRSALHKRRVRPPWRREENRMKNFDWVILFGHSKTNFDSQNGRKEAK